MQNRCVITSDGVTVIQRDLVEHIRQKFSWANLLTDIVLSRVHLPDNPRPLYMVASWLRGVDEPLILLTTSVVQTLEQAKQILWYYRQRWACEETGRFLKNRVGLECFHIRRYEAIQRLVILPMLAMGFLTWILLRSRQLAGRLFSLTSRFRKDTRCVYYRFLDGLQQFAQLYQLRLIKIPIESLKKG